MVQGLTNFKYYRGDPWNLVESNIMIEKEMTDI